VFVTDENYFKMPCPTNKDEATFVEGCYFFHVDCSDGNHEFDIVLFRDSNSREVHCKGSSGLIEKQKLEQVYVRSSGDCSFFITPIFERFPV